MKREILADGVELWCGDCLEVIPQVGEVDHSIFDPPYEDHMHKAKAKTNRVLRKDGYAPPKRLKFKPIGKLRQPVTDALVAATRGWYIAFCTPEGIAAWRDAIEAAGGRYKRACFWYKPDASPQFNGQGPGYAVEAFVTAWCGSGFSVWNGGGGRNLFTHLTNASDRDGTHETEKPLSLMAEIVTKFTQPGDTILDPFMGSGTTGLACIRHGRRFIGVEQDPAHFELSIRRMRAALGQTDLFVSIPHPVKPVQTSLADGWKTGKKPKPAEVRE